MLNDPAGTYTLMMTRLAERHAEACRQQQIRCARLDTPPRINVPRVAMGLSWLAALINLVVRRRAAGFQLADCACAC